MFLLFLSTLHSLSPANLSSPFQSCICSSSQLSTLSLSPAILSCPFLSCICSSSQLSTLSLSLSPPSILSSPLLSCICSSSQPSTLSLSHIFSCPYYKARNRPHSATGSWLGVARAGDGTGDATDLRLVGKGGGEVEPKRGRTVAEERCWGWRRDGEVESRSWGHGKEAERERDRSLLRLSLSIV